MIIFSVVLAALFAIFATQNTNFVSVVFNSSIIYSLPLYIVILGSLLLGLFVGWVFQLIDNIGSTATIYGKDAQIKHSAKTVEELKRKLRDTEIENEKLRAQRDNALTHQNRVQTEENTLVRPSIGDRLRHSFNL